MRKTAKQQPEESVVVGTVVRHGTAVMVPPDMPLEDAAEVIRQQMEYEEQVAEREVQFPAHPYEVAYAFSKAIERVVGVVMAKGHMSGGFFAQWQPPQLQTVEVAPGEFVSFPWGHIQFPHDPKESWLNSGYARDAEGNIVGEVSGSFPNKFAHVWDNIIQETRRILQEESLFRGRALRVSFGDAIASIKPWDVKSTKNQLVFTQELEQQIEDNIYTPILDRLLLAAGGTPFKRGVLLAGKYGTGKTQLAAVAAKLAIEHGITVLYNEDAKQLPQTIRMAAQLAPALVFVEDIERATDGKRSHEIDLLLNTLDGIDTKTMQVMTILTTNYPEKIYKGMIRPGRIDIALEITPPDSAAAQRLVKTYLGDMFDDKNGDLEEVGNALTGMIPAVIREVCERSKLSHISRTHQAPGPKSITADDVLRASASMKNQLALLNSEPKTDTEVDKLKRIVDTLSAMVEVASNPEVREFVENNL